MSPRSRFFSPGLPPSRRAQDRLPPPPSAPAPSSIRASSPSSLRCSADMLIRKRPHAKVVADVPPQPCEPVRLDDQKEDDQAAKDDQPQMGNEVSQVGLRQEHATGGFQRPAGHDRQQRDKDRTEDRAQYRAEAADDHHRQIIDRDIEL